MKGFVELRIYRTGRPMCIRVKDIYEIRKRGDGTEVCIEKPEEHCYEFEEDYETVKKLINQALEEN